MNEREQIVARINQINEQLDNGLDNNLEYYRLLGERDGLQQRLATIDNDFSYDDPLSGEYSAVPANDEFLYNNEEQLINSELQQIEAELEAIRAELRDRAVNDSNALTHEEIDNYQRRIIELERRKNELLNNSRSIEPNPTIVEDNNLNRAKEIVDELEKLNKELNKYFSGELTSQFGNEPAEIQRKIANLEEELELLKSKLTPEQLEELNNYINNKGKTKTNLFEEAKKIINRINELEEELRKYYSGELTDNFGVRSSEINRELEELRNRLNQIKSKLTPEEIAELETYINKDKKNNGNADLLEEAKKIVDKITELEEELRKYYSGELTDNFGVRSSEINRELEELKNRLEEIKSKLTPKELEELENYIKNKKDKKEEPRSQEQKKEEPKPEPPKEGPKPPIPPTPEPPKEIPKHKPIKVSKVKKWICEHKKLLIALGVAALAAGTIALAINLGPALIAGKMVANGTAWWTADAATKVALHETNMALGAELAKAYGTHAFFNSGVHYFAGTELAKVASVAAAKVAASIAPLGLGAGLLTAGIKGSTPEFKHYKKQIDNMRKYFEREVIGESDLTDEERLETIKQLALDLKEREDMINASSEMTKNEKKNLNKKNCNI